MADSRLFQLTLSRDSIEVIAKVLRLFVDERSENGVYQGEPTMETALVIMSLCKFEHMADWGKDGTD